MRSVSIFSFVSSPCSFCCCDYKFERLRTNCIAWICKSCRLLLTSKYRHIYVPMKSVMAHPFLFTFLVLIFLQFIWLLSLPHVPALINVNLCSTWTCCHFRFHVNTPKSYMVPFKIKSNFFLGPPPFKMIPCRRLLDKEIR